MTISLKKKKKKINQVKRMSIHLLNNGKVQVKTKFLTRNRKKKKKTKNMILYQYERRFDFKGHRLLTKDSTYNFCLKFWRTGNASISIPISMLFLLPDGRTGTFIPNPLCFKNYCFFGWEVWEIVNMLRNQNAFWYKWQLMSVDFEKLPKSAQH